MTSDALVFAYISDKTTQGLPTEKASYHKDLKLQHHTKTSNLAKLRCSHCPVHFTFGVETLRTNEAESQSNLN